MTCPHEAISGHPQLSPRDSPYDLDMARKKRSSLPPVTEADLRHFPDRIRPTPRGAGWAWKCAHCQQFASSETLSGQYVCRSHGGTTPRQRDPLARQVAKENGRPVPTPPGRPPKTGRWSKRDLLRVDEIFEDYKARKLNPDATDDDMLYLRAMLECQRRDLAAFEEIEGLVVKLREHLQQAVPLDQEEAQSLRHVLSETQAVLTKRMTLSKRVEKGHERLIKLAKVRADTRLRNRAAEQVGVFMVLVQRMQVIFEETLTPEAHAALQARFARELQDVPNVNS